MNYIYSFLFTGLLLFTASCSKKEPEPPEPPEVPMLTEATQTGKHTFSFMLNDEVWVSDRGWGDLTASITVESKTLRVSSEGSLDGAPKNNFSFDLFMNSWSPETYINRGGATLAGGIQNEACDFLFNTIPSDSFNVVEITHIETSQDDLLAQWISGTFQFRVVEDFPSCGDTMYITNGRFDLRYQAF